MLMKNPSEHTVSIPSLGITVAPGGVVDVEDNYCRPRPAQNGSKLPPVVEMLAPQLIPADASIIAAWKARTLDLVAPPPTSVGLGYTDVSGLPPAVRQMVEDGEADAVPPKQPKPVPAPKQQAQAFAESIKKSTP